MASPMWSFFGKAAKKASGVSESTRRQDVRIARQYDPSMSESEARRYTAKLRSRGQMLKKNPTAAERNAWDKKHAEDQERARKAKKTREKNSYQRRREIFVKKSAQERSEEARRLAREEWAWRKAGRPESERPKIQASVFWGDFNGDSDQLARFFAAKGA